ncbi:MAG: tRNA pseudouridine(38-40) synthase TruA [Chloroflexi bacterium]|nr:tRNA pseudouridine(38-40) synthase TruA [Chloroflexota bacterium]
MREDGRRPRAQRPRRRARSQRRLPRKRGHLPSKNWKAQVAYDGTRYAGAQVQANAPTVQGELERALGTICGEAVRIVLAGRTDAGVHATGQVISFRTGTQLDRPSIRRGVNALLPQDIAIRDVEEASDDFHARFSATGRAYEYRIRAGAHREPLERHREHWVPQALDREAMERAARMMVGRHDFAAFATGAPQGRTEREVRLAAWKREGTLLRFEIEANGFLRGMVRAIVGTLLWVGTGHTPVERIAGIVASKDRSRAGPNAPAAGLCLVAVRYDGRPSETSDEDDE